jgi:predicted MFS family arabinose efflux permease
MVQFVNILDFMMVMPLGDDFSKALHIDSSDTGYVSGAYTAAAFTAGIVGSRFLDRFNRKSALLVSLLGLAVGTLAGGLATGFGSLVAARVVAGAFGGPATSLSLAIVADVVPIERRGRAMGVVMAGFSIASVAGLPAGLALARHGSWRTPFLIVAGVAVVVFVVGLLIIPSAASPPRAVRVTPARELLSRREIVLGLSTSALVMTSVFLVVPNVPAYLMNNLQYPRDDYELLYLAGGVGSFIALVIGSRMIDKVGTIPVMSTGSAIAVVALATGFLGVEPFPIAVVFVLFMMSAPLRGVSQTTLASRLPAPHERAQYMSLQSAVQHIAMTAGAVISAAILTSDPATKQVSPMWVVTVLAIACAASAPLVLIATERALARRVRR